ncbi:MAG TPA: HNH endonuclease [Terracidiphilus sp.]|jgi:putative restriction endonuclease|nr:HNH endonuclease [Terracidiphilus sp.]
MANNWTRAETILAFNLYCKIPFGRIDQRNPEIIALANRLRRSPGSVSYKLANLARLDPALRKRNIAGASHGSKMDEEVWNEFQGNWDALAYESELLLSPPETGLVEERTDFPEGGMRESLVKTRINQRFFRAAVLAAYEGRCFITGLAVPELLNASHIIPWKTDAKNRTNPRNGLCLNRLHDAAFDCGLLTVTPKLKVRVSPMIEKRSSEPAIRDLLMRYKNALLKAPRRFAPDPDFLQYHNDVVFQSR